MDIVVEVIQAVLRVDRSENTTNPCHGTCHPRPELQDRYGHTKVTGTRGSTLKKD